MRRHIHRAALLVAVTAAVAGSISCTSAVRQGTGSSYLIIDRLEGIPGQSGTASSVLLSDVVVMVKVEGQQARVPTIVGDSGRVTFRLGMKDAGSDSPSAPTFNNFITVNRYRVTFTRTDGRNTAGVDVPHPFEGAFTVTVSDSAEAGFTLVRNAAKVEPPLLALRGGGGLKTISTIAEVTFYGQDQTGHAVTAIGRISVEFADWADEE